MPTSPLLSIVIVGRNDNYGGRFLTNLNQFIFSIARLQTQVELVLVEWNPPKDKALLSQEMFWPIGMRGRTITVPQEVHETLDNPNNLPLLEYTAKNVGIRRALGEFILSTNPDTLFSPELALKLQTVNLEHGSYYRVNRRDIDPLPLSSLNPQLSPRELISHRRCGSYEGAAIIARLQAVVRYTYKAYTYRRLKIPHENASGDFMLMHNSQWRYLQGYPEWPWRSHIDAVFVCKAFTKYQEIVLPEPLYHQEHIRPKLHRDSLATSTKSLILRGHSNWNNPGWGLANAELSIEERYE